MNLNPETIQPDLEVLICECNLVSWGELENLCASNHQQLAESARKNVDEWFDDLKKLKIIGHGCGQCCHNWRPELLLLRDQFSVK